MEGRRRCVWSKAQEKILTEVWRVWNALDPKPCQWARVSRVHMFEHAWPDIEHRLAGVGRTKTKTQCYRRIVRLLDTQENAKSRKARQLSKNNFDKMLINEHKANNMNKTRQVKPDGGVSKKCQNLHLTNYKAKTQQEKVKHIRLENDLIHEHKIDKQLRRKCIADRFNDHQQVYPEEALVPKVQDHQHFPHTQLKSQIYTSAQYSSGRLYSETSGDLCAVNLYHNTVNAFNTIERSNSPNGQQSRNNNITSSWRLDEDILNNPNQKAAAIREFTSHDTGGSSCERHQQIGDMDQRLDRNDDFKLNALTKNLPIVSSTTTSETPQHTDKGPSMFQDVDSQCSRHSTCHKAQRYSYLHSQHSSQINNQFIKIRRLSQQSSLPETIHPEQHVNPYSARTEYTDYRENTTCNSHCQQHSWHQTIHNTTIDHQPTGKCHLSYNKFLQFHLPYNQSKWPASRGYSSSCNQLPTNRPKKHAPEYGVHQQACWNPESETESNSSQVTEHLQSGYKVQVHSICTKTNSTAYPEIDTEFMQWLTQ